MLLYETGIAAEPAEDAYGSGRKYKAGTPAPGVILGAGGRACRNLPQYPDQDRAGRGMSGDELLFPGTGYPRPGERFAACRQRRRAGACPSGCQIRGRGKGFQETVNYGNAA